MTDKTEPQAGEGLPDPQDVTQPEQQIDPPAREPVRPADTEGYDLARGSEPATRGASGHRA